MGTLQANYFKEERIFCCGKTSGVVNTCDDLYLTSIAYYQKSNTQAYLSTAQSLQAKRYGFTHHVCYTLT